ncbi:MoaD/ThiS family protein [Acinetobacter terrae]|uniref:MoaD/ThiS family protein n=1 Tax=Acinetobacter terrae TaxID=2731247 RepID=A0A4R0EQT6_9GAMM|nr:MoaD/ThiS family protein [Acinetobacter terrae]TCB62093.1 MoaD/ThiS family protein [Acinetobacter terrae]
MQQITIKIEAFGAVERQLPQNLEIFCSANSTISDVLDQITQECPAASAMIERCACAMGEDIIPRQSKLDSDSTLVLLSPVAGG